MSVIHVLVVISYIDGSTESIKAIPNVPGSQYWSYPESIFKGGLARGWLEITDIDGNFHAIRVAQIRSIDCKQFPQ